MRYLTELLLNSELKNTEETKTNCIGITLKMGEKVIPLTWRNYITHVNDQTILKAAGTNDVRQTHRWWANILEKLD